MRAERGKGQSKICMIRSRWPRPGEGLYTENRTLPDQRLREGEEKDLNGDVAALFVARRRLAVVQYRQLIAG